MAGEKIKKAAEAMDIFDRVERGLGTIWDYIETIFNLGPWAANWVNNNIVAHAPWNPEIPKIVAFIIALACFRLWWDKYNKLASIFRRAPSIIGTFLWLYMHYSFAMALHGVIGKGWAGALIILGISLLFNAPQHLKKMGAWLGLGLGGLKKGALKGADAAKGLAQAAQKVTLVNPELKGTKKTLEAGFAEAARQLQASDASLREQLEALEGFAKSEMEGRSSDEKIIVKALLAKTKAALGITGLRELPSEQEDNRELVQAARSDLNIFA